MKDLVEKRIADLTKEIQALHDEKSEIADRVKNIDIRIHQLVGAVYELHKLIADLDHQHDFHVVSQWETHPQDE